MKDLVHLEPAPVSGLAAEMKVRMRDGVHLATDVYLPDGDDSPGDTILIRLPYDKSGSYTFIPLIAEYFMARGYRVVAQDVRGKFRSEGRALLFVNEVDDGRDTLDWLISQSWSNGRVAMWGDSYYGFTQWAAAASGHPGLKAISPRVTGTQLGEPVHADPGDRTRDVEQSVTNTYPLTHFFGRDTYLWDIDWTRRDFSIQVEAFLERMGERSPSYDQWVPHPVFLPRFPDGDPFAARSVPTLHTIGWWDNCAPLSWADVTRIEQHPAWAAHHHLRIEAMDHEGHFLLDDPADRCDDLSDEQLRARLPRILDPTLEFFEVFVRGLGNPDEIPRVTWNLAGTSQMRSERAWPPPESRRVDLRAVGDGRLITSSEAADRIAVDDSSTARRTRTTEVSWVHDPLDPVPSSVPDPFAYLLTHPDEAPIGHRDDVLVFTSSPQSDDVDLAGPAAASICLRSDGPVLDCFIRLLDLAPDGTAIRIARGQRQLRDATRSETLSIDLGQIGYRLRAGHRLRLHVCGSDYPEFLPQPGTGRDPWTDGLETTPNTHTALVGGEQGLSISLPVLSGEIG